MDNLEFRKFLTTYGITYDEYQNMEEKNKQELIKKFNSEIKTDNIAKVGQGLQGCGCLIITVPILIILLYFLLSFIKGLF